MFTRGADTEQCKVSEMPSRYSEAINSKTEGQNLKPKYTIIIIK
jgi:hypothetical protein